MKKTWNLINELSSRNVSKTKKITQLDFEEREITAPEEIAETFNSYFSGIGEKLASDIPNLFVKFKSAHIAILQRRHIYFAISLSEAVTWR